MECVSEREVGCVLTSFSFSVLVFLFFRFRFCVPSILDNPINQKILSTFMRRKKIRFEVANNGREAVEKWRTGGFHLILVSFARIVSWLTWRISDLAISGFARTTDGYPVARVGRYRSDERDSQDGAQCQYRNPAQHSASKRIANAAYSRSFNRFHDTPTAPRLTLPRLRHHRRAHSLGVQLGSCGGASGGM